MKTISRIEQPAKVDVTISITTTLENWAKIQNVLKENAEGSGAHDHWHPANEFSREIRKVVADTQKEFWETGCDNAPDVEG